MLYATPLEISRDNHLESSILEKFSYDPAQRQITFVLREGLKYSDGTSITIEDVATAILRLARTKPKFPTISHITGLKSWLENSQGLHTYPSGLQITGKSLNISLDKSLRNPLFRFTLEVFSVIPSSCIDKETLSLTCKQPPASGHFVLESATSENFDFVRRSNTTSYGDELPEKIRVTLLSNERSQTLEKLEADMVVSGWESGFAESALSKKKDLAVKWLPRSWFTVLIINPEIAPFDDRLCRMIFADEFRSQFNQMFEPNFPIESSLFTTLLPGYLKNDELKLKIDSVKRQECLRALSASKIRWTSVGAANSPFRKALVSTLDALGVAQSAPNITDSYSEVLKSFSLKENAFLGYSSGFWALDPVGDAQMFFTPGLHAPLAPVTSDPALQTMLSELDSIPDSEVANKLHHLNRYLHDNAVLNVVSHGRRFYAANNDSLMADPAFALASPTPWQVFSTP